MDRRLPEASRGAAGAQSTVIHVRAATEEDVPAIAAVYVRAYAQPPWNEQNDPGKSEEYLRWVMRVPGTHCLVAVGESSWPGTGIVGASDAVAGFVLAGPRTYEQFVQDWQGVAEQPVGGWPEVPGKLAYIWEIAVDPNRQRRGYGAALLGAAVERLAEDGFDWLILRSSERAVPAVALYRRFTFQRLPVRERRDPLAGPWLRSLRGAVS